MNKLAFTRILIFYSIAIVISNIFRFDVFQLEQFFEELPTWVMVVYGPLQAVGILLGTLIAFRLLEKQTGPEISIFGTSRKWSIIMAVIPVILLLVLGVNNKQGENVHYFGFIAGLSTFIYCFSEEIGWRGYLEEELKNLSELKRVLIISGLWYFWHLSFLSNPNLIDNVFFFGWLLFGSWGLGKVVQLTKSVFAAAYFHMVINIVLFNGIVKNGLGQTDKVIVLVVLIPIWILILAQWKKETTITSAV